MLNRKSSQLSGNAGNGPFFGPLLLPRKDDSGITRSSTAKCLKNKTSQYRATSANTDVVEFLNRRSQVRSLAGTAKTSRHPLILRAFLPCLCKGDTVFV